MLIESVEIKDDLGESDDEITETMILSSNTRSTEVAILQQK